MPRTPSGNTSTHSPASSISRQVSGVPEAAPLRAAYTDTHGSSDTQYSAIPRTRRGGSASSSIASASIAASKGSWPAWFAISSARPGGTRSMSWVSTRK